MTELEKAARMALEALVDARVRPAHKQDSGKYEAAITAIREALAEQPAKQRHIAYVCPQCHWTLEEQPAQQQEPFGHVTVRRLSQRFENHHDQYHFYPAGQSPYLDNVDECHAVYTSPQPAQQQEWRGPVDWEEVAADYAKTIAMMKGAQEAAVLAEREACEALYAHEDVQAPVGNSAWGEAYQDGWIAGAQAYRDAIRARGQA